MESRSNGWLSPQSRVSTTVTGGLVTVTLGGEIDLLVVDLLEAALGTATDAQPADVVIDLGAVTFIGSQALSFLVRMHHLTAEEGRLTTLQRVPPMVRKAMVTVGLDLLFALEEPPAPAK
ncbi:STAS domain-containing protein [Cryptosporangium phraense]|uniref:STAS domain-containing protein n=1 Tax=Cryptosporangium phraense TaxID=2593070 RepID=A0A545AT32_9ACTN|nr:STAS domain-containing protein [Cryptosporangium phraense]TQS44462.1 STAS domain-containing protein [Cryptosporangium phraense]